MSTSDITLRKADLSDYQAILDITKEEGGFMWEGMDYIPFALKNWLEESEQVNSKRDNIVFVLNDEVVGFESFYFLNNGRTVARFGFRLKQSLRGKGYGRKMLVLQLDYLREHFSECEFTLSAIPDIDLEDSAFTEAKFGQQMTKCVCITLNIDLNDYKIPAEMDAEGSSKMAVLTKDQFRGLLQNGRLTRVCKNECLHMNWVPILLQTDDDIEFAVRKNAVVITDNIETPKSFSVLTFPFPCPAGYRCSIDIFGSDDDQITNHLYQQLITLLGGENEATNNKAKFLRVQIYIQEDQVTAAFKALKMLKLENYQKIINKRNNDHMYVYKDKLYK